MVGFKLQENCTCCRAKATNNPSNLFQTHGPGLLPSTLLGKLPFILGPCSEHLGNSQKVLKQNDLCDCRFFNFSSEKFQPLCRAKLGEEWGASRRHTAAAGKDVLLRESAQIWWSGSEDDSEREVAKPCVSNVSGPAATLKLTAFTVFMQCSFFQKKSALILFPFNQSRATKLLLHFYWSMVDFRASLVAQQWRIHCNAGAAGDAGLSRTLLFTHPIHKSLHPPILSSQSLPPLAPSLLATTRLSLCLWVLFCFIDRFICIIF